MVWSYKRIQLKGVNEEIADLIKVNYKEKFIYDFAAVVMIAMVLLFAMGMATADWVYKVKMPYITIHP